MGLLDSLTGLLSQYTGNAAPAGDPEAHFQEVARSVDSGTLAHGIEAAMQSDQTPPFAQIVSQLFASGSNDQKLAMLDTLLASASPAQRQQLESMIPGLSGGAPMTGSAAAALSPNTVESLAQHVEQQDTGIVGKMSALYAEHPTLVKTLGSAAMMIAMRKIAERHA